MFPSAVGQATALLSSRWQEDPVENPDFTCHGLYLTVFLSSFYLAVGCSVMSRVLSGLLPPLLILGRITAAFASPIYWPQLAQEVGHRFDVSVDSIIFPASVKIICVLDLMWVVCGVKTVGRTWEWFCHIWWDPSLFMKVLVCRDAFPGRILQRMRVAARLYDDPD